MEKQHKKLWVILSSIAAFIFVASAVLLIVHFSIKNKTLNALKHTLTVQAEQIDDSQKINVSWKSNKMIDSVTIEVLHGNTRVTKININDTTTLLKGSYEVDAFYGKQTVKVTSYNSNGTYTSTTTKTKTVKLTADEYVIAPITATMPVTLFTLSLKTITNDYTTPTFVWFKRPGVWEYSEMPENVNLIPVCDADDFIHDTNQNGVYEKVSKWVKELYELNPNSKFNLYYNDYYPHGWLQATVGNNIPEENYNVTLLSDGAGSFTFFNDRLDNENYASVYAEMKAEYEKLKTQVQKTGKYPAKNNNYKINSEELREYIYVMAKEESNVDWWLTRVSGTLAVNTPDLYTEVQALVSSGDIKVKDLKTLLLAFSDEEQVQLKKLFNFSDTMFEKAKEENKEVMVFLGTWNQDEENFDGYIKTLKALYGDEYVFYYKGHPKSPTETIDGKFDKLDKLGVIDIDSTIPAELIFFFNPEVFASGYQSSTFLTIDEEKSMSVVHVRKDAFSESYKDNLKSFITKVESSDATFGSLVTSNNCFLVEYVDTTNYDISIFDANKNTMKNYKKVGTDFVEVTE